MRRRRYKIEALIDQASARLAGVDSTDGYNVRHYFRTDLVQTFETAWQAESVAKAAYKGPDADGVGCTWEIVPVDD